MGRSLCTVGILAGLAGTAAADPHFGVMADVGVPDGGTLSLIAKPHSMVRLDAGVGHDLVGPGVRGGVTWVPLRSWITPTLGVSAGRFFEADANPLARRISGDPTIDSPMLQHFGYDFANARLGLELGRKSFTFFIHGGYSIVTATIHNVDSETMSSGSSSSSVTVSATDPHVRIISVSASLGFIVYL
jgi:hypothetical protein